ncbi:bifunctional proline dehydrogenase/L-glutamate gamma-semialdehyde dehydrogenase PutA [Parvularcula sp. LCG005]|uniref:bifunctional proline dehydrogenase/L-glutamate gamma-semialdehyde dehydrogenase PutA n=1 Tax=Parvularcula sp. LCG005 TaxID=3078805 RepID=UPI0029437E7D|nr:bifunctional proline dehydrogenase/L-glutamate gamma-semialdehyde dehydrogenase PutA [Parvularcula sp. LCG005]WOI53211.1 bifunctional proline dehydrogenase/L-glutamate gamma-semialdehyde dehydrogenase PutA [Parvularcula sp. LCG005]
MKPMCRQERPSMSYPEFNADYAPSDADLVQDMLAKNQFDDELKSRIRKRAEKYVDAIRHAPKSGGLEDFMQEYSLSTKEGLALMVLAESLLRVPDRATQDMLIEEKLSRGDWDSPDGDEGWLLMAASWGIGLSAKIVTPGETPGGVLRGLVKRVGTPVIRTGTRQAMQYLGHNFVLGQTIEAALDRAKKQEKRGYRYSYDMLGEGARTAEDAERYFKSYSDAIDKIAARAEALEGELPHAPGISVKLSALHQRYFLRNKEELMVELVPRVLELALKAKEAGLNFTMDAEEADRLEISLDIFAKVAEDERLAGWIGYGLAVQAYQKRAPQVIQYVGDLAKRLDRQFMVRLVKGAYWDTEIKRAQERGLDNFPVYTRKAATDLSFLECSRLLLAARPRLYPQFATHNALTMATLVELGGGEGFEFQRLHGMGEPLYKAEMEDSGIPCRIYAPVGGYRDLLAYLVRRMLENAANSSFVAQIADDRVSIDDLLTHPQEELRPAIEAGEDPIHPLIRLPLKIYPLRLNSRGAELGHRPQLGAILDAIGNFTGPQDPVTSFVNGHPTRPEGTRHPLKNPSNLALAIGEWAEATEGDVRQAFLTGHDAFKKWNKTQTPARTAIIRRYADLLEENHNQLIGILVREAGKTMDDAIAEVREAIDFCRYYANMADELMVPQEMPGPVGETNIYRFEGRGVFGAIAPWNFPLAIFVGQIVAALVSGNAVVAKPAPQTPLIATRAVELMHDAGLPPGVCNLVLGAGQVGSWITEDPHLAGIVFTGSTKTAKAINLTLANRDGPILPFIAETGGINAMVVDSTALPEQVVDDVVSSAFRSAGQRCSALRILYLQDDVADRMLEMIVGATKTFTMGDPANPMSDTGPIIDEDAVKRLEEHWEKIQAHGKAVYVGDAPKQGSFFSPRIIELDRFDSLDAEAFGPILHVVRFQSDQFDQVLEAIGKTGYGLTFGIHSRLEDRAHAIADRIDVGNVYINRNQIGAVVGVQPFGGRGLSGTGPKAGGPLYITRFCEEKTITENTTAAGGNASLIALSDE